MLFPDSHEIANRLKKYPVLCHFSQSALEELVSLSETVSIPANQILFSHNDVSDSVYYLMDGYLECFSSSRFIKKVASIRSGEMVGEMDAIAGKPRGISVRTMRDSQLLKINKDIFLDFFKKKPELLMLLAQTMAIRLRNMIMNLKESHYEYKNIGLISVYPNLSLEQINTFFQPLIDQDGVRIYNKESIDSTDMDMVPFLSKCQENLGVNLFFSADGDDHWNNAIFNHVDYVYIITAEGDWDRLDPHLLARLGQRPCDLVIMHQHSGPYTDTAKFYFKHPFKRHHHLMDTKASYQRLYRYMTGQAIGLVISGGGFRGFAHYGLVKALFEARVPIDYIGGSSMGAAIGALLAIHFDWSYFDRTFTQSMNTLKGIKLWRHLTFPLLSILNGSGLTRLIKATFGQYQIEDLSTNFFCVVANLSKSKKDVKKSGELWEWLRASTAIPGLLPPFEKNGSVYVDGGICTNLPVQDMRDELNNVGTIIALDIRIPPFRVNTYHFPPVLTFKNILAYILGFSKQRYVFPALFDILMESSSINQYIYDTQGAKKADIMVAPDTSLVSFKQSKTSDSLILLAYELAQDQLMKQKSVYERWII